MQFQWFQAMHCNTTRKKEKFNSFKSQFKLTSYKYRNTVTVKYAFIPGSKGMIIKLGRNFKIKNYKITTLIEFVVLTVIVM